MRPIKLFMTAFGPYAGTQVLDFRQATDSGLFGIYGPTGSGKSSIFNAIAFALFGKSAKDDQSIASLRSDHSQSGLLTEVALVFEVGSKAYLIRRQPDQMRPGRGGSDTKHAHCAWLFDVTGIPVEDIVADGCGAPMAEKKVTVANDLIVELLGYGAKQFCQIVLLPQGHFERFLTSNSNERLAILRDLFDVSLYRRLAEAIRERGADAIRDVRLGHEVVMRRLAAEGLASSDELREQTAMAEKEVEQRGEERMAREKALQSAADALRDAEELRSRFLEKAAAEQRRAALLERADDIAENRARLAQAERARQVNDLHQAVTDAEQAAKDAETSKENAEIAAKSAASQLEGAKTALEAVKEHEAQIDKGKSRLEELGRYDAAVRQAADLQLIMSKRADDRAKLEEASREAEAALENKIASSRTSEAQLSQSRKLEAERAGLAAQRAVLATVLAQARDYDGAVRDADASRGELEDLAVALDGLQEGEANAREESRRCEEAFIAAQASLLAHGLSDGDPCPVCGATEHPQLAQSGDDPQSLKLRLETVRAQQERAAKQLRDARERYAAAEARVRERDDRREHLAKPDQSIDELQEALTRVESAIAELGPETDPDALDQSHKQQLSAIEVAREVLARTREDFQTAQTEEAVARRSYENEIAGIPREYRDSRALAEEVVSVQSHVTQLRDELGTAQSTLAAASETHASANTAFQHATVHYDKASDAVKLARTRFAERLTAVGLAEQDFHGLRSELAQIDELKSKIADYDRELGEADGALNLAAAAVAGKEQPDLSPLQDVKAEREAAAEQARQSEASARAAHTRFAALLLDLSNELVRLQALEESTGPLRALDDACSGNNDMKTPLETFALGTLFDEVLEAANLRLEPMTDRRYRLERDIESSGGVRKRGLDIKVHDVQTGRARDLSTLSGGETFIAALSLALGLSDVVEATHGGIRLDTVFVDEGFGSLDADEAGGTLETVLRVLQDVVGQSRSVGLISHVPMVQEAVPNGFSVSKGLGGSIVEVKAA